MPAPIDITGQKWSRLTAISRICDRSKHPKWRFSCDCGSIVETRSDHVKAGFTTSCGCANMERVLIHGGAARNERLYSIWGGMRDRCARKRHGAFHRYGGRGIRVCAEWSSYDSFRAWALANGYSDEKSIDRINNDGDYEPGNCRWANAKEQARNRPRPLGPHKLTESQVRIIRAADLSAYGSQVSLARHFGVSRNTIRKVKCGISYPPG